MLTAAIGTTPPDLPEDVVGPTPYRCAQQLVASLDKGIRTGQKLLGACELSNVLAASPVDCTTTLAQSLADNAARVDGRLARCKDTTGLLGCPFGLGADPTCLGSTATQVGTDLVRTVFGAS